MKKKAKILIAVLFIIAFLLRDVINMYFQDNTVEDTITNTLNKKYPDYKPGSFGSLLSHDLGTTNPPYFIHHIYSEGGDYYKFSVFNIDKDLNILFEEKENLIQTEKPLGKFEHMSLSATINVLISLPKEELVNNNPYRAIVMLQELLDVDSNSIEVKSLLAETLINLEK